MRFTRFISVALIPLAISWFGCKPEPVVNPYDPVEEDPATDPVVVDELDMPATEPGTFPWIHEKVFMPTCANSGCHDGTFEPDFRTVGSSYNTLVMHPVISNDAAGNFSHRVVPGDPPGSLLLKRLLEPIPNTSGQMPLEVDESSDWPEERDNYLEAITDWIAAGAPNAAGDLPVAGDSVNLPPVVAGFGGFPLGNFDAPFERDPDAGYALVVEPGLVDLWFAFEDEATPQDALQATLRMSGSPGNFAGAAVWPVEVANTTFEAPAFFGETGTYGHHLTLDLSEWMGLESDTTLYLSVTLYDGESTVTSPGPASPAYMSTLFSLIFP